MEKMGKNGSKEEILIMDKNKANREYWLDLVKGLANIGVVLQHSLQRTIYYFDLGETFWLPTANDFVASVNMQWFFVVSGYIYFVRRDKYLADAKTFFKTRFIDLMIPYLILGPAIWLGKFASSAYVKNQVSINDLLDMFVTPIAFMWFIYVLFFVEIIIYALDKLTRWRWELALTVLFVVYVIMQITTKGDDVFRRTAYYLFWYYLGGIFVFYKDLINSNTKKLIAGGGLLWIIAFILHLELNNTIMDKLLGIVYALSSTMFVTMFFRKYCSENKVNSLLNYLGNRTMYIYILNPIIINGLRQVLVKTQINDIAINFITFFLGAILIACLIAEIGKRFALVGFIFTPRKYIIKKNK